MLETIFIGSKARLARIVVPFFLLTTSPLLWVGWEVLRHVESDQGSLLRMAGRLLLGGGLLATGVAVCLFCAVYGLLYVQRLEIDRDRDEVRITTSGYLRGRSFTVRPADFDSARFHAGYLRNGGVTVNAPWSTLRLRGRRLPLILDEAGEFLDPAALERLIHQQTLAVPQRAPRAELRGKKGRKARHRRG